jgi:hypothetical protein
MLRSPTLQQSLMARLDRLGPAREVALRAPAHQTTPLDQTTAELLARFSSG